MALAKTTGLRSWLLGALLGVVFPTAIAHQSQANIQAATRVSGEPVLAAGIAEQVKKIHGRRGKRPIRIAVLPFTREDKFTQLGKSLAESTVRDLRALPGEWDVMDVDSALHTMVQSLYQPEDLQVDDLAYYLGVSMDVDFLIAGEMKYESGRLRLKVHGIQCSLQRKKFTVRITMTGDETFQHRAANDPVLPLPPPPDYSAMEGHRAGAPGISDPMCIVCPPPSYTPEANKARIDGVVVLRVMVAPSGRTASIQVVREQPLGLTQKAIEAVSKWRFEPAMGPGRRPLPVWVTVEVVFRHGLNQVDKPEQKNDKPPKPPPPDRLLLDYAPLRSSARTSLATSLRVSNTPWPVMATPSMTGSPLASRFFFKSSTPITLGRSRLLSCRT